MTCDNIRGVHNPITIAEDNNALRVFCTECKTQIVLRKDPNTGAPEKREYARVFKRDILQGNDNLFYKLHPEHISVI